MFEAYFENITRFQNPKHKASKFKQFIEHLNSLRLKNVVTKIESRFNLLGILSRNRASFKKFKSVDIKKSEDLGTGGDGSVYEVTIKYKADTKVGSKGKIYFLLSIDELEDIKQTLEKLSQEDRKFSFGIALYNATG